ncbi:MAG: undecaprenyl/decaprenyl-phosphate alpha-N-acetylglucosaminyl 1-phosphate transferase [Phycisphaerae bacterium]|nr:undecaprenyl/decaprenyl-phosphate alpha-N-acetylglucosaminyl 1-phosphate transferase [Phycisphaerae bacterium]
MRASVERGSEIVPRGSRKPATPHMLRVYGAPRSIRVRHSIDAMQMASTAPTVSTTGFMLLHAAFAVIVGVQAVAVVRRVALAKAWMAKPREDRWHREPVALHGGVGVLVAWLLSTVVLPSMPSAIDLSLAVAVLPSVVLLAVTGLVDDLRHLKPWTKLLWQVIAAAAVGWTLADARGLSLADAGVIAAWGLIFCNSVNMLDNMDGACATAAIPGFLGVALVTGDPRVASIAGAAAGAMAAFWIWNRPRARIFLGDAGALPIGLLLGALAALVAIEFSPHHGEPWRSWTSWIVPALIGLPFMVDTGFVCVTRAARGQNPMIGGTDHLTHRALRKGWSPWGVLAAIAALGAVGVALVRLSVLNWS